MPALLLLLPPPSPTASLLGGGLRPPPDTLRCEGALVRIMSLKITVTERPPSRLFIRSFLKGSSVSVGRALSACVAGVCMYLSCVHGVG